MQERFHHRQDAFVSDRSTHPVHGGRVVDVVETRLDITFEHPLIRSRGELVNFGDRVMCPPFRTETIGTWFEVHLEDRFEHQLQGRLHGTVPRGRDAQSPAFTTTGFGNHPLTHRQRTELSDFDTISQPCRKPLLGGEDRSGRPLPSVAPDPRPRNNEDCRVTHKVEQVIEPAIRIIDRPLCNLVWIRSTCDSTHSRSGHNTSVFTDDLLPFQYFHYELAAALGHVTGFPGPGLLRRLRHVPTCLADDEPTRHRPGWSANGTSPGRFPRSPHHRSTG